MLNYFSIYFCNQIIEAPKMSVESASSDLKKESLADVPISSDRQEIVRIFCGLLITKLELFLYFCLIIRSFVDRYSCSILKKS